MAPGGISRSPHASYRMRLVGAAVDIHFKFSIDNHTMTVMAADSVTLSTANPRRHDTAREGEIAGPIANSTLNDNCDAWAAFQDAQSIEQDDSGV
ncbi:Uu.00g054460.m01.CDS01 [Anthostomella pinea]|uniref:Uu.00g054460.m01.CDS01 n=1 Tax=Anthostomella pinea TaxID=933095 RepID=A0AAI8VQX3_9PEZI|nr:Uu.00g054460.m01.CDS01 [Anthostomella pinea]